MKSKNCSHEVQESDEYCGICRAEVVFESEISTMKKCPSCNDLQNPNVLVCTKCQIQLIICIGKRKDGSNCEAFIAKTQNFCKGCGSPVILVNEDAVADEFDGRTQTQVTQPILNAGSTGSPKEKTTEPGDVTSGNKNQSADGHKVKGEIDSREQKKEVPTKKCTTRGLAVICYHQNFKTEKYDVSDRKIAPIDNELMDEVWKLYGCEILDFKDGTKEFYLEKLISEIKKKLKEIGSIDYFVFVLSTHGEEVHEVVRKKRKNSVNELENSGEKEQSHKEDVGQKEQETKKEDVGQKEQETNKEDVGQKEQETNKEDFGQKEQETNKEDAGQKDKETKKEDPGQKDKEIKKEEYIHQYHHYFYTKDDRYRTKDVIDAIGELPELDGTLKMFFIQACRGRGGIKEDNEDFGHDVAVVQSRGGQSNTKTNMTKGVDNKDAVGSLPKEDKEPDHVEEIPITLAELHYNDCVVVFGSMSGKYAYRKENDPNQGSWLIRALHTTMIEHNKLEDTVHILDILTGVNREVSLKEAVTKDNDLKAQSCFLHNLTFSDETLQFRFQSSLART